MKPRCLEIEGLNSFIEKQKIDFSQLTEKGLFGIFGHTGSGKSTILDGIILALYGKISRDSTGYINSQCEKVEVKYEFEIGTINERKIYRAERAIKKDKKGGYKTSVARLIEKNNESGDIALAEGSTAVKKKIQEIVGLSLDDFTRSVVLPQGKFSEFLKLSGKERSNMLERIFRLEKYGKNLTFKIRTAKKQNFGKLDVLTGEMKKYEGVSKEGLEEVKTELNILKNEVEKIKQEKAKIQSEYENYKNIWELQLELKLVEKNYQDLIKENQKFKIKKEKVTKGKRALNVKPYIENFEETLEKIKYSEESFAKLEKELNDLNKNVMCVKNEYNLVLENKEKILPKLIEKETNLKRAIELKEQAKVLKNEREDLVKEYNNFDQKYKESKGKLEQLQTERKINVKKLEELNNKLEFLKVDPEYREAMIKEINNYYNYKELKKTQYENSEKLKGFTEKIQYTKFKIKQIVSGVEDKSKKLEEIIHKKEELDKKNPGDSSVLLEIQNTINELSEKLLKGEEARKRLNELNIIIDEKTNEIEKVKKEIEHIEKVSENKENHKKELIDKIENIKENNMVAILISKLEEGKSCPVCGSKHHVIDKKILQEESAEKEKELLKELEKSIKSYKNKFESLKIGLASLNNDNKHYDDEKKQVEIVFKQEDVKELEGNLEKQKNTFEKLKIDIEQFNEYKLKLDNEIAKIKEEKSEEEKEVTRYEQALRNYEDNFNGLKGEVTKLKEKIEKISDDQNRFKDKFKINDIQEEYEKIVKADKEKSKLDKMEIDLRNVVATNDKIREKLQQKISELKEEIAKIIQSGQEKKKEIDRIIANIKELSYGEEPEKYIEIIRNEIEDINNKELTLRKTFEKIKKEQEDIEKEKISEEKNKYNLYKMKEKQEEKLQNALLENQFKDYKEAEIALIDRNLIEDMEKDIDKYIQNLTATKNNMSRIHDKLSGQSIEKENWEKLKKYRVDIEKIFEEKVREEVEKDSKLVQLDKLLKEKVVKEKEKGELEHKASLLEELDKLITGNKLVDFVAMSQLKYIALDASRRLKDITRGRYALEINEDGEFIIRDDFNGGIRRTTSTLSGGETFLASLSLALALSSQIQLKGRAPLEFFFLDEGFGTLDSDLLDTVISSLEKLHSERLCVGIISHVDELKNRVPIKLLVTPAKVGEGGTKVKVEVS